MGKCASSVIFGLFVLGIALTTQAQADTGSNAATNAGGEDAHGIKIASASDFHTPDTTVCPKQPTQRRETPTQYILIDK